MITYLGKLLTNTYDYEKGHHAYNDQATSSALLAMKTVTEFTESLISKFQSQEIHLSSHEQKGAIIFIIIHFFILLLTIAIFRVVFTPPGAVPEKWNIQAEDELAVAIDIERNILRDKLKKRKEDARLKRQAGTTTPENENATPEGTQEIRDEEEGNPEERQLLEHGVEIGAEDKESPELMEDPQVVEQLNQVAFYNAMKKENKRFCAHCQMFKPTRAHHCRQCNRCVLKMDHHCPWVGNCVGYANYKYFINMVFYGVILLWIMVVTYTEPASDTLFNLEVKSSLVFLIFFTYLLNITLALVITGFFCFHMWLVYKGKTTLEFVEDKKTGDFNFGIFENAKVAFGTDFLLWCIPTSPNQVAGNGLEYKNKHPSMIITQ